MYIKNLIPSIQLQIILRKYKSINVLLKPKSKKISSQEKCLSRVYRECSIVIYKVFLFDLLDYTDSENFKHNCSGKCHHASNRIF